MALSNVTIVLGRNDETLSLSVTVLETLHKAIIQGPSGTKRTLSWTKQTKNGLSVLLLDEKPVGDPIDGLWVQRHVDKTGLTSFEYIDPM